MDAFFYPFIKKLFSFSENNGNFKTLVYFCQGRKETPCHF